MPQKPKIVEAERRFTVSPRYVTDEGGRFQVAAQPLTTPKSIDMSGPGRIVTPPPSLLLPLPHPLPPGRSP
jgi:hypothetical protein